MVCIFAERIGTEIVDPRFAKEIIEFANKKIKLDSPFNLTVPWVKGAEEYGGFPLTGTVFEVLASLYRAEQILENDDKPMPVFIGVISSGNDIFNDKKDVLSRGFGDELLYKRICEKKDIKEITNYNAELQKLANFLGFVRNINNIDPVISGWDSMNLRVQDWLNHEFTNQANTIDISNPFRGLGVYQPDDRSIYFGRDNSVRLAYNNMVAIFGDKTSLMIVTGGSGFGKSSFVRAGLIGTLENDFSYKNWSTIIIMPNYLPASNGNGSRLFGLIEQICSKDGIQERLANSEKYKLLQSISKTNFHIGTPGELAKSLGDAILEIGLSGILLAVDQFEELLDEHREEIECQTSQEGWSSVLDFLTAFSTHSAGAVVITLQTNRLENFKSDSLIGDWWNKAAIFDLPTMPTVHEVVCKPLENKQGCCISTRS